MRITELTRRDILEYILQREVHFNGRLEIIEFLERIWDLESMPSTDGRFQTASQDIWQHMINNNDWDDHYLLWNYLRLRNGTDEEFIKFIEEIVHPILGHRQDVIIDTITKINELLKYDGHILEQTEEISGRPIYKVHASHPTDCQIFGGRYRKVSQIGNGGMGNVYEVLDITTGQHVALKACSDTDPEFRRRFEREVRIMASINDKNVILILDHYLELEVPFFTMPLAQGNLSQVVDVRHKLDDAIELFISICIGVKAIHDRGVFHRDIKPENILIINGQIIISDLGLAKFRSRDTTVLTTAIGRMTELYAAPEQWTEFGNRDADARTDIYQLGKTFYYLFTGISPLYLTYEQLPLELRYIIEKATKYDLSQRYQNINQLIEVLEETKRAIHITGSPSVIYENLVERGKTNKLLENELIKLCQILHNAVDNYEVFLEMFDKIPKSRIADLAMQVGGFRQIMDDYSIIINKYASEKHFGYAEVVADKMSIIIQNTKDHEILKNAYKSTLCAAVDLNRFAAMDTFKIMLKNIQDGGIALIVAEMLRDEINRYKEIYDQLDRIELHPTLQKIWDLASQSAE